jgi:ribosomal protein S12 methylthiotransferase accessory factor
VVSGASRPSPTHAQASALCEALERHSGNYTGDEERVRGSLRGLGERAIHPDTCQLYHERQFRDRRAWNAVHSPFQHVPAPFDEDAVLDWTPLWSLSGAGERLLPTRLLYYGAPNVAHPPMVRADSNGNAAGGSLEDAVLRGLLELVERDSVALWWYNRTRAPAVDLDAFADPWVDELRQVHAELGREVWALDLTADLQTPAMAALSRVTAGPSEAIVFGFGCHPDAGTALRHALTELNQAMPAVVEAGPDALPAFADDPDATHWFRHATLGNQPYLAADPAQRPRRPGDYPGAHHPDLLAEIGAIQATLSAQDMDVLVLDQTRPDIELPVVKVVVPGLRPFWARFAPGRLYDVPVRLGRRPEPTPYERLNPIPLFV